jgi:ATP synthase protein I
MPEVDRGGAQSLPGDRSNAAHRSGDAKHSNDAKRPNIASQRERVFPEEVEKRSIRKLRARRRRKQSGIWFGLGMFGLVGWSVAIPVLIFLALGIWIDNRSSGPFSWTLMLLVLGVILGSIHAWFWITKERKEMEREREEENLND